MWTISKNIPISPLTARDRILESHLKNLTRQIASKSWNKSGSGFYQFAHGPDVIRIKFTLDELSTKRLYSRSIVSECWFLTKEHTEQPASNKTPTCTGTDIAFILRPSAVNEGTFISKTLYGQNCQELLIDGTQVGLLTGWGHSRPDDENGKHGFDGYRRELLTALEQCLISECPYLGPGFNFRSRR
jgi:hypothetical protein